MTTTAHEDQFTAEPEPVRQPYDTGSILRRNVADLELALKQQTERAEAADEKLTTAREDMQSWIDSRNGWMERAGAAEAELAKMREQKPALYMAFSECGQFIRYWTRDTKNLDATIAVNDFTVLEFFASPVPAPAVPSGWNIRRDGDVLIVKHPDIGGCSVQKEPDWERMIPEAILYSLADALLQSADHSELAIEKVAPDCRACANRGRINGLSQESYCDSCIYQGRDWRQNHFVDVSKMVDEVNRRCEACAILPCSCK